MTFKTSDASSYPTLGSPCSDLKPGRYRIKSRLDDEFVQATWLGRPLNVGPPSPHTLASPSLPSYQSLR